MRDITYTRQAWYDNSKILTKIGSMILIVCKYLVRQFNSTFFVYMIEN